jgi:hypothetical protein
MKGLVLFVLLLAFGVFASTASADSIPLLGIKLPENLTGPGLVDGIPFETAGFDSTIQWVGFSFVLGRSFHDVSITMSDIAYFGAYGQGPTNQDGLAYLTNGVGLGVTSQNTIATAPFAPNSTLGTTPTSFGSYTLFGNVDLGPGTYDFFFTVPIGGWGDWGGGGPVTGTSYDAPGVGYLNNLFVQSDCFPEDIAAGPYAPPIGCGTVDFAVPAATEWNTGGGPGPFLIAGTPVPEPNSVLSIVPGLFALAIFSANRLRTPKSKFTAL